MKWTTGSLWALALLAGMGCGDGGTEDTNGTGDVDAADGPAINDAGAPDRPGTYVDALPTTPSTVVFLGDSITAGAGAPNPQSGYAGLLVDNRAPYDAWDGLDLSTRYPDIDVIDVSRGGAVTQDVLDLQIPSFENQAQLPFVGEVLVVVTIGGNDLQGALFPGADASAIREQVVDNWRAIARYFLNDQRFPDGSTVLMANVYEPTDAVGQVGSCFFGANISGLLPELDAANIGLRELAVDMGFGAMDLRGEFLGHGFYFEDTTAPYYNSDDPSFWFDTDCIHPNPRGHHELRRLFWRGITGEIGPE